MRLAGRRRGLDASGRHTGRWLASSQGERAPPVLALMLGAGLDPNTLPPDGRSVLLHPFLQPEAARILLAHGADRLVHDPESGLHEWSPVTVAVDQRHWATAAALLMGGVPPDHATPRGSLLEQMIHDIEALLDETDRGDPDFLAFMAVAGRQADQSGRRNRSVNHSTCTMVPTSCSVLRAM
jgi:hypothetical protein